MRKYLYRGIRKDNNEWVYGFLIIHHSKTYICFDKVVDISGGVLEQVEVIPETVSKYIGIDDRNGDMIWENSIVIYQDEYGKISWHNDEAMFVVEFDTWFTDFDHLYGKELEVVGSVFENSELLER